MPPPPARDSLLRVPLVPLPDDAVEWAGVRGGGGGAGGGDRRARARRPEPRPSSTAGPAPHHGAASRGGGAASSRGALDDFDSTPAASDGGWGRDGVAGTPSLHPALASLLRRVGWSGRGGRFPPPRPRRSLGPLAGAESVEYAPPDSRVHREWLLSQPPRWAVESKEEREGREPTPAALTPLLFPTALRGTGGP
jgi:hypothetical protein